MVLPCKSVKGPFCVITPCTPLDVLVLRGVSSAPEGPSGHGHAALRKKVSQSFKHIPKGSVGAC